MDLADGTYVPDECVEALEELEKRWPGATLKQARGAIVATVLKAYAKKKTESVEDDFEPRMWWRVVSADGSFQLETKDARQAKQLHDSMQGSKLYREFGRTAYEWRECTRDDRTE